jgi:hypothetical protein
MPTDPSVTDAAIFICKALVGMQVLLLGVALVFSWITRIFSSSGGQ